MRLLIHVKSRLFVLTKFFVSSCHFKINRAQKPRFSYLTSCFESVRITCHKGSLVKPRELLHVFQRDLLDYICKKTTNTNPKKSKEKILGVRKGMGPNHDSPLSIYIDCLSINFE